MLLTRATRAAPAPLDRGAVRHATEPLLALFDPPAGRPLSGARRRALGGRLFADAPRLVRLVAQGLDARPDLFPDVPIPGAKLAACQEQADCWRELRDCLRYLSEQAGDRFLLAQGAAIDHTLSVLRQVAQSAGLPFPCGLPDPAERRVALGEALVLAQRLHKKKRRRALKAAPAKADAASKTARRSSRPASRTRKRS